MQAQALRWNVTVSEMQSFDNKIFFKNEIKTHK